MRSFLSKSNSSKEGKSSGPAARPASPRSPRSGGASQSPSLRNSPKTPNGSTRRAPPAPSPSTRGGPSPSRSSPRSLLGSPMSPQARKSILSSPRSGQSPRAGGNGGSGGGPSTRTSPNQGSNKVPSPLSPSSPRAPAPMSPSSSPQPPPTAATAAAIDGLAAPPSKKPPPHKIMLVDLASPLGLSFSRDLRVTKVHPDGQAEKAGISSGSIVIAVAGKQVKNVVEFQLEMRRVQFEGDEHCEIDFQIKGRGHCKIDISKPIGMSFSKEMAVSKLEPGGQGELGGMEIGCVLKAVGGGGGGAKINGVQSFMEAMRFAKQQGNNTCVFIFEEPERPRMEFTPPPTDMRRPSLAVESGPPAANAMPMGVLGGEPGRWKTKEKAQAVIDSFLTSVHLSEYSQRIKEYGVTTIEQLCNPAVVPQEDYGGAPISMTILHAMRFRAAVDSAKQAEKILIDEGLERYVCPFVDIGVFGIEALFEVDGKALEKMGLRPLQIRKFRLACERVVENQERRARRVSSAVSSQGTGLLPRASVAGKLANTEKFSLYVKTFSGQTAEINDMQHKDTVDELREKVAEAIDSKSNLVKLFFKGNPLTADDDAKTLASLAIGPRSVVHMVLKPSRKHSWVPLSARAKNNKLAEKKKKNENMIEEGDEDDDEDDDDDDDDDEEEAAEEDQTSVTTESKHAVASAAEVEEEEDHELSLTRYIKTASFAEKGEFSRIALALLKAVEALHAAGKPHGALTLKTIHIDKDSGELSLTTKGRLLPAFMAPELTEGEVVTTCASDVFAIGTVFWQLWYKTRPWEGKSSREVKDAVDQGQRLPFEEPLPPAALKALISACWTEEPRTRPGIGNMLKIFQMAVTRQLTAVENQGGVPKARHSHTAFSEQPTLLPPKPAPISPLSPSSANGPRDDEGPLPYDGNLQDAMRSQDRNAIRRIMKYNQQQMAANGGVAPVPMPKATLPSFVGEGAEEEKDDDMTGGILPYGGDLTEAMRLQDRPAIQAIMKHNAKTKRKTVMGVMSPAGTVVSSTSDFGNGGNGTAVPVDESEVDMPRDSVVAEVVSTDEDTTNWNSDAAVAAEAVISAPPDRGGEDGPLPYDGNLQEAMKAQDRDAIRQIMKYNQQKMAANGGVAPSSVPNPPNTVAAAAAVSESTNGPAESGPLPYDGNLQEAMKAQDRDAIRQIMKHNQQKVAANGGGSH